MNKRKIAQARPASSRIPITVASRKGISAIASDANNGRIVLTNHGRAVAVVDSAERIDEDLRRMREASSAVLDAAADLVSRRSQKFDLEEVCARLGLDFETIRQRARQRHDHLQ